MRTTLILATLLAATALATAQGLTRDIVIGTTVLTVQEGRIVGVTGQPSAKQPVLSPVAAPAPSAARAAAPAPATRTLTLPSGVVITVTSTSALDTATLQRALRQAAVQAGRQ